jgi:maleamate amidohydrolase
MGVETVVITGLNTNGCVRASGVGACQLGYYAVHDDDGVADRHERPHPANLFDLRM